MNLEKILQIYGLNEKQTKIYLACLELGSASVQKISRKAAIARSTTYEVLEELRNQGLISSFQKKKVKYFSADDPEKAIDLLQEKSAQLEKAMPQLRAIYGQAKVRPTVRFYQGKQQMKLVLNEILAEAKVLLGFSSAEDLFYTLDSYPEFVTKRVKQKIPAKIILRESKKARERQSLGPSQLREVRIIPASYEYHGMIFIWERKIAMFSFKKDLEVLVIESEELAATQKAMFEVLWCSLRK